MKARRAKLSSMPHQVLRPSVLYAWLPKEQMWVPVSIDSSETTEQAMVWWGNRGFCLARVRICGKCNQQWARHKRQTFGSITFVSYYCDGCVPPREVEMPRQIVGDAPTLFTMQLEPRIVLPEPGERSNPAPEDPMQLWGSLLNTGVKIKERK